MYLFIRIQFAFLKLSLLSRGLGLLLFSFGVYLTVQADIGLAPWDVFAMGISNHLPLTFGQATIAVSIIIVIIDLILREEIGLGTLLDSIIVGTGIDLFTSLDFIPMSHSLPVSLAMLVAGLFIMAFAQYLYMTACISCGPRDTFLVGLGKRLRRVPIGAVSIGESVIVLAIGWLLGGPVGIGTLISAFGIGIAMQIVFKLCRFEPRSINHEGIQGTIKRFKNVHV